jgi:long-chain acyl-CoA synthetase
MSVPRIYERIYMAMREQAAKSPLKKKIFDAAIKTGIEVVEKRADKDGFIDMSEGIDLTAGVNPWLKFKFKLFDKLIFSKVREAFGGKFRFAFSAAGSLNADLCKTFLAMGIRVCEGYGATETWNEVTVNRLNKILPGSVGKCSTTALELKVADDGELLVKGDCLFSGYWNNPKATKEAFTEDGFYRTGDIVEVLADNYLKIVDRKKGLMVLDTGKNVPSQRIESLFSLSQFIELVVPIGSERKFVSAIIVPNFDACIAYFDAKGIPYDKSAVVYDNNLGPAPVCVKVGKDFVENEEFKKLIDKEVQTVNKELESYEQIKKYFVVDYKFTEATGEMTPTLKVKRRVVMEKFKEEIDALYK